MKVIGWILLALLALAPTAAAFEGATALYGHNDGSAQWMDETPAEDGSNPTYTLMDPTAGSTSGTLALPLDPPLDAMFSFAADSMVTMHVSYGCGIVTGVTQSLTVELYHGDVLVAEGGQENIPCAAQYSDYTFEAAPTVMDIDPAAGNLEYRITASGGGFGFVQVGQGGDQTFVEFNAVAPGSGGTGGSEGAGSVTSVTIEGDSIDLDLEPTEETSETHYDWVAEEGPWAMEYEIALTGGEATIMVFDANNETLATLEGPESGGEEELTGTEGLWRIEVVLTNATGTITLDIRDPSASGETTSTSTSTTTTDSGSGNGTTTETGGPNGTASPTGESDDSPLAALPLVLAGIALLVVRRRA